MATLYAELSFDQTGFDLNRLFRDMKQIAFRDDYKIAAGDLKFDDAYAVSWLRDVAVMASSFLGTGLAVDDRNVLTAGTVQSYAEMVWKGTEYQTVWLIHGVGIPAVAMARAAATASLADDGAIMAQMLAGNDRFDLGSQADRANGLGGHDLLAGGGGNDTLRGSLGNDTLRGDTGHDSLDLDAGNDFLDGGAGIDWVRVRDGVNVTIRLDTGAAQNTGMGSDRILSVENVAASSGNDRLSGSAAANRLEGHNGNDQLSGLAGNDILAGGAGNDTLSGAQGQDTVQGGDGNDLLGGGADVDVLTGGKGADHFVFTALSDSGAAIRQADLITDFERGRDIIGLHRIDGSAGTAGNDAFRFVGSGGFGTLATGAVAVRKFDRAGTAQDETVVLIDNDADTGVEAMIRLRGLHHLTASDFLL